MQYSRVRIVTGMETLDSEQDLPIVRAKDEFKGLVARGDPQLIRFVRSGRCRDLNSRVVKQRARCPILEGAARRIEAKVGRIGNFHLRSGRSKRPDEYTEVGKLLFGENHSRCSAGDSNRVGPSR